MDIPKDFEKDKTEERLGTDEVAQDFDPGLLARRIISSKEYLESLEHRVRCDALDPKLEGLLWSIAEKSKRIAKEGVEDDSKAEDVNSLTDEQLMERLAGLYNLLEERKAVKSKSKTH